MAQFHDSPSDYLMAIRAELPLYDTLQSALVDATRDTCFTRILDLGAGTAETTQRVLQAHPSSSAVALDASLEMLQLASAVMGDRGAVHRGRLEDPLPPGPFDLVVSALAIHHLDGRGKAELFCRIHDCLSEDGRFVMADVIVPQSPVEQLTPIDPAVDFPDTVEALSSWMTEAGFRTHLHWSEQDLVVVVGNR